MSKPKNPRYLVSLGDDGAFHVYDRRQLIYNRVTRWLPTQFVYGQGGFDSGTLKYPDYVHAELWRLHESRQCARLAKSRAAHASVKLLPGLKISEV